jgi:cytochrome c oxidase cbb3-type subunit IV
MVEHDTLVWFSKTFGLFYLIGLSALALLYAYWPSKKQEFDAASAAILNDEDKPWRT